MRTQIVAAAREWLATPFHHQARLKGIGCDCAGLVVGVGKELGMVTFDTTDYARQPDGVMMKRICDTYLEPIALVDASPGDVALFAFGARPQHVAIFGDYVHGGLSIIHAYAQSRKVVEVRFDDIWLSRVVAIYRYPGIS